jgi:membrane dipeptidase
MKRVGMLVCCSHTGHRTVREVFDAADNPVIFSHSNPLTLSAHARNIPDHLIRACAATGGVIGINGISFFLGSNAPAAQSIARAIDHVVQLTGIDHVGIGLDYVFDQVELAHELETKRHTFPDPEAYAGNLTLAGPEELPTIAAELTAMGYQPDDIAKIFGGNWRRVAAAVWKPASNSSALIS